MLKESQFEVLVYIESHPDEKIAQRALAKTLDLSVGTVNRVIHELLDAHWIVEKADRTYILSEAGYAVLAPYRVKRAIFFAAGFGSRLVPVTLNTPKPLVRVHGKQMIETLLDAIVAAGIKEIYIVRGYLKEQFDLLLPRYPMLRFLDNPLYNESNNISSAYYARDLFASSYVLEADLVLSNPQLIRKYEYHTNYLGIKKERSDDWSFLTKGRRIEKVCVGALDCYQMVGISYWSEADGQRMTKDIENVFLSPGGKEKYWDMVALDACRSHYQIYVRPCEATDIIEVDTFKELQILDASYQL